jgi:hypothetical protein
VIQPAYDRGTLLFNIAVELDIPAELVDRAVVEYKAVGDWLGAPGSVLLPYEPRIYPQGSFRLGTSIKSSTGKEEYDIDLVCLLYMAKEQTSQEELKGRVGARLKLHPVYRRILSEGSRCWTLHPADAFHMDILPAIPNRDGLPESILITDKDLFRWQHSNPIGYADWFKIQMQERFNEQRQLIAKALNASVEDVPMWRVKTTLQRAVQLLKRHRDVYFQDDQDDKPISIIITTLAAKAYDNSPDLHEALSNIVVGMKQHIEFRDGVYWVPNPVNLAENFADKWERYPARGRKFFGWLERVERDLTIFAKAAGIDSVAESLASGFGAELVGRAVGRLGKTAREQRDAGKLFVTGGTGAMSGTHGQKIQRHNFFG